MPELPEVQNFRNYIEGTSLGQKITRIDVPDAKVVKDGPDKLKAALEGRSFVSTDRVGKYLFLNISDGGSLMMHFGMTGSPKYYKEPGDAPRHERVGFAFENGFRLGYNCPRKFGRLILTEGVDAYRRANKIGADAASITYEEFRNGMGRRKTTIKAALMNQAIAAGVGNWIADEVLWQARIHPEEVVKELSEDDFKDIFDQIHYVIGTALKHEAHFRSFPKEFMIHSRWTDSGRPDAPMIELENITVGGRSTYFDPLRQVKR